ncbi:pyridoxamine 5'-phosphate oxidase family protein [Frankia sp. Mgl5]|uniref:pyridoxamine 5'-phosphate oxidase family protein n=1 Tax=Frankia sp. Mgl5 TaxID=2933793 RepID=UPI00200E87B5|nr:pyridoxamine 5'-phosphate oxidase family protein [Frankia sp. Mgl5]MCK9928325.1 pyridoxamine 5'-phosphate oxidase family protein [Frankia sp. Mgl5]
MTRTDAPAPATIGAPLGSGATQRTSDRGSIPRSGIPRDHAGFGVLTFDVCVRLVAGERIGRVAFVADGEILVLPVNYIVDGNTVAFRSRVGSKLSAATNHSVVAFEVDGYDATVGVGWSVLINGCAEAVREDAEIARLEASGLAPWSVNLERPSWVRIHWDSVSGRTTMRPPTADEC